mmetsp:Transcript_16858/g.43192  ORF Transcript_16858/g.43192 Transcript_16858/m.43192 type:complete len:203 (+) Transcript_16858:1127-1735(+)
MACSLPLENVDDTGSAWECKRSQGAAHCLPCLGGDHAEVVQGCAHSAVIWEQKTARREGYAFQRGSVQLRGVAFAGGHFPGRPAYVGCKTARPLAPSFVNAGLVSALAWHVAIRYHLLHPDAARCLPERTVAMSCPRHIAPLRWAAEFSAISLTARQRRPYSPADAMWRAQAWRVSSWLRATTALPEMRLGYPALQRDRHNA